MLIHLCWTSGLNNLRRRGELSFKIFPLTNFNPLLKISSECRRKSNNQFNNVLLTTQDKVICNKTTEIREERNANSFYPGSATSRVYVQSSSNPLEISTNFVNSLQLLNTPWNPSPLCSGFSQVKRQIIS